jgi:hypothetical protein
MPVLAFQSRYRPRNSQFDPGVMSPFEDEVQPAFDPRLIDAPPQAIADTRLNAPPPSAPPAMPPISAAMPTSGASSGPRKPFLMPPPGTPPQPKLDAELPPAPEVQAPAMQQPPQTRGAMPPPPPLTAELPPLEAKQPGAAGVPTGADARDVMGDRPPSPADLALKRETQAGMDKLAARPAAPKENWGTRLATAILAMTKFAPATDLIVHPKWSSQERQYNREVETAGERIKLAQEAQKAEDVDLDRQLKAENIESLIATRQLLRYQAQQKLDDAITAHNQTDAMNRDKMGQVVANPEYLRFESAPVVSGSVKPQQYGPPTKEKAGEWSGEGSGSMTDLPLVSELATSGPSKSAVTPIRPDGSNQVTSTSYDPEGSQRFQKTLGQLAKEKWEATTMETPADILQAYPDSASRMTENAVLGYRNAMQRGDQAAANALAAKERANEANATRLAIAEMANATRLAAAGMSRTPNESGMTDKDRTIFNSLVSKFNTSPSMKAAARTVVTQRAIDDVRKDPGAAAKQFPLIYGLIQVLDTYQSAVREGEIGLVKEVMSKIQGVQTVITSFQQGQIISPEAAKALADAAQSALEAINAQAKNVEQDYAAQAQVNGPGVQQAWTQWRANATPISRPVEKWELDESGKLVRKAEPDVKKN